MSNHITHQVLGIASLEEAPQAFVPNGFDFQEVYLVILSSFVRRHATLD